MPISGVAFFAKKLESIVAFHIVSFATWLIFLLRYPVQSRFGSIMKDKVAVVTGASSGIGRATALLFAGSGCKVVALGRNESELYSLRDEIGNSGGSIKLHLGDLTEVLQVDR